MKKYCILFLLISCAAISGWGQQKTWTGGNGNWNDASNWTPEAVPVSNDVIIFNSGSSASISNVPSILLNRITVVNGSVILLQTNTPHAITIGNNAGEDFIIEQNSSITLGANMSLALQSGATADIDGTLSIGDGNTFTTGGSSAISNIRSGGTLHNAGTISSASTGSLNFASGSNYIHARNGGTIPLATWDPRSNLNITGIKDLRPGGLADQEFGNVTWDAYQEADIDLNGTLRNVKGDLVIRKTSVRPSISWYLNLSSSSDFTLNIGGDLVIEQGDADLTSVCFINEGAGNADIHVSGNYVHRDGNLLFVNVNTEESDGTAKLNLDGDFTQSGGDINFTEGINVGPAGLKGSMTVKGDFIQLAGAIRTTTGNDLIPNGLISFNGTGVQTYRAVIPANITYVNYTIENGTVLQLASDLLIQRDEEDAFPNWVGKFMVKTGGTLHAATYTISSQILDDLENPDAAFGEFNLLPGARLITANADGVPGSVPTAANLRVNLSSEGEYEFRGAATGSFITSPEENTMSRFIVDRPGGEVTLGMPVLISDELMLTNGTIKSTETNLLTLGNTASSTGATAGSFVNGPLAKSGAAAFIFPVGKSGAGFRNVGIADLTGAGTFVAEFFRDQPPAGGLNGSLVRISSCEYWRIEKIAGASGVQARVVLSWEANSGCGGPYITDPTTLRVASFEGGAWEDAGRLAGTGNNVAGTITSASELTGFSVFAVGSATGSNPLPVVFADVKAIEVNNGVRVSWSNLTERDVSSYQVERSGNGVEFLKIDQRLPQGNENAAASYEYMDAAPLGGINYYRIRALEASGNVVYSKIVSVDRLAGKRSLQLFPNPVVNGRMTIRVENLPKGQFNLRIVNSLGQEIQSKVFKSAGGVFSREMDLQRLKTGNYILLLTGEGLRQSMKFNVQRN